MIKIIATEIALNCDKEARGKRGDPGNSYAEKGKRKVNPQEKLNVDSSWKSVANKVTENHCCHNH